MTIKTLKEIFDEKDHEDKVYINILKKEAIKWIKEDLYSLEGSFAHKDNHVAELFNRRWVKRFNITEEELMTNEEINNRENGEKDFS